MNTFLQLFGDFVSVSQPLEEFSSLKFFVFIDKWFSYMITSFTSENASNY
jgi:hypothetical protein